MFFLPMTIFDVVFTGLFWKLRMEVLKSNVKYNKSSIKNSKLISVPKPNKNVIFYQISYHPFISYFKYYRPYLLG